MEVAEMKILSAFAVFLLFGSVVGAQQNSVGTKASTQRAPLCIRLIPT
jgi:hypothetical protein